MKASHNPCPKFWVLIFTGIVLAFKPSAQAADDVVGITAVSSKASSDYMRAKLADGSTQPELYSFGEGGYWGSQLSDTSIDRLHFMDVARVIAVPLANQKYFPARDPNRTKLLIMVYWGTTFVPPPYEEDPLYNNYQHALWEYRLLLEQGLVDEANAVLTSGLKQLSLENHMRDRIDFQNAKMLGYDSDGLVGTDYGKHISYTALGMTQRDETVEIDNNRYFVVLMAYDFQLLWKQKKHKLLWETRFSIDEHHNQFDRALPAMALEASKYFGQNTNGLVRKEIPAGRVGIGDVKSFGEVKSTQQ